MSDNKVDNKLDFRNMKMTQFNGSQVERAEFSELKSAKRVLNLNTILKDAYTHFIQELNVDNKPTKVTYYQAIRSARDKITFRGDVNGDLAGKYFIVQEPITRKTWVFYYIVSGSGVAPGIGDVEVPISIATGDFAAVVAFSTKNALKQIKEFDIITDNMLVTNIEFEYLEFGGENPTVDVATSGFFHTNVIEGDSIVVGEVELDYDPNGNVIYNDNLLVGFTYNTTSAEFEAPRYITDGDSTLAINPDGSINANVVNSPNTTFINEYNEVNAVMSDTSTTLVTYTALAGGFTYLQKIITSGDNIAEYIVEVNGSRIDKARTYFGGSLNHTFSFSDDESRGLLLEEGDVITVKVIHCRGNIADFNGRIQLVKF